MKRTETIIINGNGVQVTASPSKEGDRLYFSTKGMGQACWDLRKQEWVKVKYEVGALFKAHLIAAFGLK